MASVTYPPHSGKSYLDNLPGDHRLWDEAFDAETRNELISEDLDAGRSVCAVLISIVVGGLLLGILAVVLAM